METTSSFYTLVLRIPGDEDLEVPEHRYIFEYALHRAIKQRTAEVVFLAENAAPPQELLNSFGKFTTFVILKIAEPLANEKLWRYLNEYMAFSNWPKLIAKTVNYQILTIEYMSLELEDYEFIMANT